MGVGTRIAPDRFRSERWFASKDRAIASVTVEERFPIGTGGLAILRADGAQGRSQRYSLPLDDDPGTWLGLAWLAGRGGSIAGDAGGTLMGVPSSAPAPGPRRPTARSLGVDQSNTSVVVGETAVLKLYRQLQPGPNPEVELVMALGGGPIPAFQGAIRYRPPRGRSVDVAIVQEYVAGAADEFEQLAEQLAAWLRAGAAPAGVAPVLADVARAGRAVAELHVALSGLGGRLRPRPASTTDTARWSRRAAGSLAPAIRAMAPIDPSLAAELRASRPRVIAALAPLVAGPPGSTLTRIHGDMGVPQLVRDGARFLVVDFEGEPTRPAVERRRHDTPIRDVASMLRSIDHVTRSAIRRSGAAGSHAAVDGWLLQARGTFLDAYGAGVASAGRPARVEPGLLHALEVEKELYEFAYAARYLPAWRYAPAGGLRWLLDRPPASGGQP